MSAVFKMAVLLAAMTLVFTQCSEYDEEFYTIDSYNQGLGSLLQNAGKSALSSDLKMVDPEQALGWSAGTTDSLINAGAVARVADSLAAAGADTLVPGLDLVTLLTSGASYQGYILVNLTTAPVVGNNRWIFMSDAFLKATIWAMNGSEVTQKSDMIPAEVIVKYRDVVHCRYEYDLTPGIYMLKVLKSEIDKTTTRVNMAVFQDGYEASEDLLQIAEDLGNSTSSASLVSKVEIDSLNSSPLNVLPDSSFIYGSVNDSTLFYDLMMETIASADLLGKTTELSYNPTIENLAVAYILTDLNAGDYIFWSDQPVKFRVFKLSSMKEVTVETGISLTESLAYPIRQKASMSVAENGSYLIAADKGYNLTGTYKPLSFMSFDVILAEQ